MSLGRQSDPLRCHLCGRRPNDPDPVLICPACGTDSAIVAPAIAYRTLHDGPQSRACEACEQVTIVTEPEMVCSDCEQLYPDVSERLRRRFAEHGPGDPSDAPCVGCGHYPDRPRPPGPVLYRRIECQGCDAEFSIAEADFVPGQGMHVSCADCGRDTWIPPTVWCPKCGRHLRRRGWDDLIREANARRRRSPWFRRTRR